MTDIVGIVVGHTYYYLEDIYPAQPNGWRMLKTPAILKRLIDGRQAPDTNSQVGVDVNVDIPAAQQPEGERPGGWQWQAAAAPNQPPSRIIRVIYKTDLCIPLNYLV